MKWIDGNRPQCRKHNLEGCICEFKQQNAVAPRQMKFISNKREWAKHEITPEISRDLTITGRRVPRDLVKKLRIALRAQQSIVARAVRTLKT